MKKRWLAILLAVALCLPMLPTLAAAEGDEALPTFAYYSAPIRSEEFLLGNGDVTLALDPQQATMVYLVWNTAETLLTEVFVNYTADYSSVTGMISSKFAENADQITHTANTLSNFGLMINYEAENDLAWLEIICTDSTTQQLHFDFYFEDGYSIGAPPTQTPTLSLQGAETVELPTYTYFTAPDGNPTRDPNNWIGGSFPQEPAELPLGPTQPMRTYLVWEKAEVIPRDIEVNIQGVMTNMLLIHSADPEDADKVQQAESNRQALENRGIAITYGEDDELAWLEIGSFTSISHTISFAFFNDYNAGGPPNDFAPAIIRIGEDAPEEPPMDEPQDNLLRVEIDGETYTFGFGVFFTDGRMELAEGEEFAVVDGSDWDGTYVLGILDEAGEPADAAIYDLVSDLEITIPDYSPSSLNEGPEPTATVLEEKTYLGDRAMHTVMVSAVSNAYFEAEIRLDFKVDGEPYFVPFYVEKMPYNACSMKMTDPSEIELLSDPEAFLSWMEENYPAEYNQYMNSEDQGIFEIYVALPEGNFTEIIDVRLTMNIHFSGSEEGDGTTMAGVRLLDSESAFSVSNVRFVASDSETYTYDGETFTCGVLAVGDEEAGTYGSGSLVENCTFEGYDYAVRCMKNGNIGLRDSIVENCRYGYYMACGDTVSSGNKTIRGNVFSNCEEAIHLEKLPFHFTPYELRVLYCDFLDNQKDLVVAHKTLNEDQAPAFYFYMNYFGRKDGVDSVFELDSLSQLKSRKAQVSEQNDAVVYTNPRYALPCVLLQDLVGEDNTLTVDGGRNTFLLENYALGGAVIDMALSSDALSEEIRNALEPILISGVDEAGEVLYTWTFENTEE